MVLATTKSGRFAEGCAFMNTAVDFDLSLLPGSSIDSRSPLWWGQIIMAAIEGTLFVILMVVYLYYRSKFNEWPPPGIYQPFALATFNTVLLLFSCLPVYGADKAVEKNNRMGVIIWETVAVLCGLLFLYLRIREFRGLDFKWNSHIYGSITYAILWLHSFDYAAALLESVVLIAVFVLGRVGEKQRLGIRVSTILYYFLVGIWVPLYCLVYVYPRWLQS
jgi:heme/copper-type cytochrome/quinol oxidase subunit 3